MKFNALDIGIFFTWWEADKHLTGIKTGERQAFCLNTREFMTIHHNKDVKDVETIPEDLELKFGRNGQAFLCSPVSEGNTLARRIIMIGGEIMHDNDLKTGSLRSNGGEQADLSDVYITLEMLGKKIKDLETVFQVVKIAIEDRLSVGSSDNRIMSTTRIKKLALPTE